MKSIHRFFIFILFLLVAVPATAILIERDIFSISESENKLQPASINQSLEDVVKTEDLKERYKRFSEGKNHISNRIKVLIVPGHDQVHHGADFEELEEVDLNIELAKNIYQLLLKDKNFRVYLASDENGYNERIKNYLDDEKSEIEDFRKFKREVTENLINSGEIELQQYVAHNSAPEEVANVLYGINRYANEQDFDMVIHVHFNDYPGRKENKEGKYSGFSIYVPASQFLNGSISKDMAENIFEKLSETSEPSNHPAERAGVIQDTELIAVGAFNSVNSIALLLESGYIYEPKFADESLRTESLKELAEQTYLGIKDFFED